MSLTGRRHSYIFLSIDAGVRELYRQAFVRPLRQDAPHAGEIAQELSGRIRSKGSRQMKRNRKWWMIGVLAVIAVVVVYAVTESRPGANPSGIVGLQTQSTPMPSPGTGRVTMIDLGATECIPCKMMAPILEELKIQYAGKADILFIDVWKVPEQAKIHGIQTIPTQIFFDDKGREVFRHIGFMDKKRIVDILSKLGVS
jgi:thioredoxin 1